MRDALVAGTTDPDLARRQRRKRIPALRPTSTRITQSGSARSWAHRFPDVQVNRLPDAIEEQIRSFAPAVELPCAVVGIQSRGGAECIVAEIGAVRSAFPSARHLASSAGQCLGRRRAIHSGSARGMRLPRAPAIRSNSVDS
jgi:hypothetical protein